MRFRRAVAAFAVCALAPATALAQDARMVEVGYEITFAGFTGFRVDFSIRFNAGTYDAESHVFKEGVLRALTSHYEGRNRAWGTIGPTGPMPGAGSLSIVVSDKTRTWLAQYGPGGELLERHNPPWKPEPKQEIPEDKKRGSLDPLTSALSVGMAGDNACQRTAPSNDGKRRIDVILKQVGSEPPLAAGVPQAKDTVLICDIYTKRVAGEFYDAPQEAESERERPMRIWLGRLDDTPFRYPVKLEAHTGFGTIRGRMLFFRERPLSEQEKTEMRR